MNPWRVLIGDIMILVLGFVVGFVAGIWYAGYKRGKGDWR